MFQYDKYGKNTNATQKSEIIYRLHSMKGLIRIYFRHLTGLHKFNPHNKYKYSNKTWLIDMYSSINFSERSIKPSQNSIILGRFYLD